MFNKLRYQLLSVFIFLSFVLVGLTIISFIYIKQKSKLEDIHQKILIINNYILNNSNTISNFFTYDTKNPDFFVSGKSNYLKTHKNNLELIRSEAKNLQQLNGINQFGIIQKISSINHDLDQYDNKVERIVELIQRRGYKDFGTEGKMRDFIHQLEDINEIDVAKVLMLRRHEKDYIIRNEEKYIKNLLLLSKEFRSDIQNNPYLNLSRKDTALHHLDNYLNYFNLMVYLDRQIGIKDNSALRHEIHILGNEIISEFNLIKDETIQKKEIYFKRIKFYYIVSSASLISLCIFLSFYLSKRITKNISILSTNISDFVSSNFDKNTGNNFPNQYNKNEVGLLIDNYLALRTETLSLIHGLQKKVEERTHAINCQKDKINQQKEEIASQRDELYRQNQLIDFQKKKTEQQNKDIISSIQYAKLIQEALLPSQDTLNRYFSRNFIYYKPKDILSGDFYWAKRIKNNEFDLSLIAAVDCTGHGVPGALMSMLGIAFLNEIVLKKEVTKANHVLDLLREKVIESFQNHVTGSISSDGMDISFALIDHDTNKLHFTGANRPLYLVRDNDLKVITGDKMPIGKHGISHGQFNNNIFDIQKHDVIYLFTDGYADQFGGPKNKKFKRQRLRELILKIHNNPMDLQKEMLEIEHAKWRGNNRQTDDILILGIRL